MKIDLHCLFFDVYDKKWLILFHFFLLHFTLFSSMYLAQRLLAFVLGANFPFFTPFRYAFHTHSTHTNSRSYTKVHTLPWFHSYIIFTLWFSLSLHLDFIALFTPCSTLLSVFYDVDKTECAKCSSRNIDWKQRRERERNGKELPIYTVNKSSKWVGKNCRNAKA